MNLIWVSRLLVLVATLSGPVSESAWGASTSGHDWSGPLKQAQSALSAGDYPRAYPAFLAHSKKNPLAQFTLGLFHQFGWGRPIDLAEACRWQEKAAKGNIPAAQQALADCLKNGIHRPADAAAAAHWYEQAALSGILTAPCSLGELYMTGNGVAKDPVRAIQLCQSVAEKNLPSAQLQLARLYADGDESVRDFNAAWKWMQVAAQANLAEAQFRLGIMYRDGVGRTANPVSARWWLETAAEQGFLAAYLPTAELYLNGPIDPTSGQLPAADLAKAYLWAAAADIRLKSAPEGDSARLLLNTIMMRMPETWKPDLDRQVTEHLAHLAHLTDAPNALASNKAAKKQSN